MPDAPDHALRELLRVALARRAIVVPEADVAAGAALLASMLRDLEQLACLDLAGLEPTAHTRFDG